MSNPSRFDIRSVPKRLLSGVAGETTRKYFLGPDVDPDRCHIFDIYNEKDTTKITFLPGTKSVILMGSSARDLFFPELRSYSVNAQRGGVYFHDSYKGLPFVLTYSPQDTFDPDYLESSNNPLLSGRSSESFIDSAGTETDASEIDEDEGGSDKDHSPTSRSNWRFWFEKDIAKAKKILYFGIPQEDPVETIIYPKEELIYEFFEEVLRGCRLYLDIETDSNYNINTLGLSTDNRCLVIPFIRYTYEPAYPFLVLGKIVRLLQRAFNNEKVIVVIHNALYDLAVLALKYNVYPPAQVYDTMLAQHRCFPEAEKSLGHSISMWTTDPFHKDEGVFEPHNHSQEQQLWAYNGKDLLGMRKVYIAQTNYAGFDRGLQDSIAQVNACVVPYLYNTLLGIRVDTEEVERIISNNNRLLVQYRRVLSILVGKECGHELLPTSSKSCAKYFHELLGYKVIKRTDSGAPSLGGAELYKLKLKYPENIAIDVCLKYRQLVKESGQIKFKLWKPKFKTDSSLAQSYSPTRATTNWKISGTKTFRLSSSKWLCEYGTNLQNPIKSALHVFCADEGKAFIQVDQAGAEALIVAFLTRKGNFRELFLNGIKSHNYVALHLYFPIWCKAIPEALKWLTLAPADLIKQPRWKEYLKLIKADEDRYYIAKKTCHAANYGMREDTFINAVLSDSEGAIVLSKDEATRFLGTYHGLFPEIHEWHLAVQQELTDTRELRNLFGYPRKFYGVFNSKTWMEAYAFVPQSTVGTITNIAFTKVHERIQSGELAMDLLNNKHDSLLAQVDNNTEAIKIGCAALSQELEQRLVSPKGDVFFMKSEASYGYNWAKYDKDKNPKGMRDL